MSLPTIALTKDLYSDLKDKLSLPVTDNPNDYDYCLAKIDGRLALQSKKFMPFFIDFSSLAHRCEQAQYQREPLAKACGITKEKKPFIVDATAGLARDSFILASYGCPVLLLEKSSLLSVLLEDALKHGAPLEAIGRMVLLHRNALDYFSQMPEIPDVIYLDPMFPENKKSALVKKDMQILQDILEHDDNNGDALLEKALTTKTKRIVVKRHRHSDFLGDRKPSHQIQGKTLRFDVYCQNKNEKQIC